MSDTLIAAYFGIGGTIIGAVVGGWCTFQSIRKQQFYASAAKLKQAFMAVLIRLRLPADQFIDIDAIEVMENSFWDHERAVIEFRYALPKFMRTSFDSAWIKYKGDNTGTDKLTNRYFNRDNWQKEALKNIEGILEFTEYNWFTFWYKQMSR